ncbi:outer membrane channel protein TolC [Shewanella surugensis]|uniref:Outer membrane channel protein TolC n=1 Tax=Shewanella surugensis TaxID=212020 RepID=A0ABT0LFI3_9GAMM|nr:outer membrane channel protein TolC [Shewanella surugensis]MCL1126425.1 outer membrane channel protein TolC [Shewanella surugensis]
MKFKIRSLCIALTLAASANTVQATDLLQIYEQALTNDPATLQAKAARNSLYEQIEQSRASLLPTISGSVSYTQTRDDLNPIVSSDGSTTSGGFDLSQTLYDNSLWSTLTIAEKTATQADATYAAALQDLIIRVSSAYFDVLSAQDDYEFQGAERRAYERQLAQTKQRFAVGLSAITDVHSAQAQYDLGTASEITAENTLINSYESLRAITGIDYTNIDILDTSRFSATAVAPTNVRDWVKTSEEESLLLLSDKIGKDIAEETIAFYKSGHLPTLSLSANADRVNANTNSPYYKDPYHTSSVTVTLDVPIFSGFSVDSQVKQAQYDYVNASEVLEQTHRSVVQNVRSYFNNVNASISSIRAYEQSVISSQSALEATQAGFEVGTRTIVDVLNSTSTLYSSKSELSTARYNYINSVLALKQAAGSLNEKDLASINRGLITPPTDTSIK